MVLQRRLEYGFNGYQVPVVPRASRSPRGRGPIKKKIDAKQKHAFEILATVANKLLLESSGSDCSNTACVKDLNNAVNIYENQKEFSHEKETRREKASACMSDDVIREYRQNQCPSMVTLDNVKKSEKTKKLDTLDNRDPYVSSYAVGDVNKKKIESGPSTISKIESFPFIDGPVYPTELDQKPAVVLYSESEIKNVPLIKKSVAGPVLRHYDKLKVASTRDGDEKNHVGCFHPGSATKASSGAHRDLTNRRVKKLSTLKRWEVAPNLFRTDGKQKPVNHNGRSCYTRQRSPRFFPSKTAFFDRSSVSKCNGTFFSEGVFTASDNHQSSAIGGSSSIAGGLAPSRCGDGNVKLSIKSFKVPELVVEIPANATVGSLKRSVMEAVTAALGDGLHVGVLLQGKKVRDDSKTLFQTGISRNDKHCSLGFMLEPKHAREFPSQFPEVPLSLHSVPSHGHINGKTSSVLGPDTSNVSRVPALMDLNSYIKTGVNNVVAPPQAGTSTENVMLEAQPLVAVPAISKETLTIVPFRRKSTRPDMVQRRIRRPFSVPEVEALVRAVEELGTGRWRDVKLRAFENVKHRTYVDLKDKWKTLVHTARISPQQRRGEPVPQELLDRVLGAHAYWSEQQAKHQIKSCSLRLCL